MKKEIKPFIWLLLFVSLIFCFNNLKALPATCGAATNVAEATSCVQHNYTLKKTNGLSGIALPACASGANFDGWRKFTANATSTTITLNGSSNPGQNPAFAVYSACNASSLVTCANATGPGGTETATFATTIGTTYYIRVMDIKNGAQMAGQFCVYGAQPAPTNDDICNAITVTCGSTTNGTTVGATTDAAPTCATYTPSSPGVWYKFTPTSNWAVTASLCNAATTWDTQMYIYSGTSCTPLSSLTCVGANDDGTCGLQSVVSFAATAGTTYYILVSGYAGATGAFELDLTCAPPLPPSTADCQNGTTVCNNSSFIGNSSGSGNVADLSGSNEGCLSGEHQSSWYEFQAQTSGTLAFLITSQNGTDDYDFALWGPYTAVTCPPTGAPLRCSYAIANTAAQTGLQAGAGDNTEGAAGDGYVNPINVTAGDIYILLIDNFSATTSPFDLDWSMTNGATLNCVPLGVTWQNFSGYAAENNTNVLNWITATESNSAYFKVERSSDAKNFIPIGQVAAAGNSATQKQYQFTDVEPVSGTNYYRLKEVDVNGRYFFSKTIAINSELTGFHLLKIFPNPTAGDFTISCFAQNNCDVNLQLINMQGEAVNSEKIKLNKGYNNINYSFKKSFSGGSYLIRLVNLQTGVFQHAFISKQ